MASEKSPSLPLPGSSPSNPSRERRKLLKVTSIALLCFLAGSAWNSTGERSAEIDSLSGQGQEVESRGWGLARVWEGIEGLFKHKKHHPHPKDPFHFRPCTSSSPHYLCGYLTVPLNYLNPHKNDSRTIDLAVTMYQPKPGQKSPRTLVIEPGGPGGSGTNYVWRKGEEYSRDFTGGEWDVLGWDPRGVNLTNPAISCFSKDAYRDRWGWVSSQWPETRGLQALYQEDAWNEAKFAACKEQWSDVPRFLTTASVARDVDSIRSALNESTLTAYMVSYGTGIAQTYTQMFPDKVGRIVMDGMEFILDHRQKWGFGETSLDNVTAAFEDGFVGECVRAGVGKCALTSEGPVNDTQYEDAQAGLSNRLHNLFDALKTRPMPGHTHQSGPGIITYEMAVEILYGALYRPASWTKTAEIFAGLEEGNATLALEAANAMWSYDPELKTTKGKKGPFPGHYSLTHPTSAELSSMVVCGDAYDGEDKPIGWWADLHDQMIAKSWISGTPRLYSSLPCRHFDWESAEVYRGGFNNTLNNPVVLIGETYDPATPLRNAKRLAAAMGDNARLLIHHGYGHASQDRSACTVNLIKSYIHDGILPKDAVSNCYADGKPYLYEDVKFQVEDFAEIKMIL